MRPTDRGAYLSGPNGHLAALCYSAEKMSLGTARTEWPVLRSDGTRGWAGEAHPGEMMDEAAPQPEGISIFDGNLDHSGGEGRRRAQDRHGFIPV